MDRSAFKPALLVGAMLGAATAVAAAPGDDPRLDQRLEAALGTYVISQLDRSVQLSRTMPPPVEHPRKRAVDDGEAVRMSEHVYVDRALMPGGAMPRGEDAVRVFPRDARQPIR